MDVFHPHGLDHDPSLDAHCPMDVGAPHGAMDGLTQSLAIAHVAHGMDPLQAALQAQLEAPLLGPILY